MNQQVEKAFNKAETQRIAALEAAGKLTAAQLSFKPDENSWCILEVFDHLMTAEKNGLKYMTKKMLGDVNKMEQQGLVSKLRLATLNFFLRLPIKFKAPPTAKSAVRDSYDYEPIKAEWDALRADWSSFLEQLDDTAATKLIFKHPLAGRLSVAEALGFMYEHLDRHQGQIERIKAHANYPK